jgi:hypothetical protein
MLSGKGASNMTHAKVERSARLLVGFGSAFLFAFGLLALVLPERLAQLVDLSLASPSAFADLRAMYGGLSLAVALFLLRGARDPAWLAPGLFMIVATLAAAAGARLYSIAVSGMPNELVLGYLAAELLALPWPLRVYLRLSSAQPGQPARSVADVPREVSAQVLG